MNSSRRYFLKTAALSTLALAAGVTKPFAEAEAAPGTYKDMPKGLKAKRWVMVIDTRQFRSIEDMRPIIEACHKYHNVPTIEGTKEVKWIWDDTFEHAFTMDPSQILPEDIENRRFFLMCNHCTSPSCVRVCPPGATYKTEGGLVAIDYHRCIGCRFCMAACPYGSRSFNFQDPRPFIGEINTEYPTRMRGVVEKCTFCVERLEKGLMPVCVEASNGAILFGDVNDPDSDVRRALAENFSLRRKPELGTDPGIYYII
ncbi:MAG: 4Fe-4S dicluster domain-containing protein [Mailhella sp.]|nr:4Fe-4S dicluster domain-containing protein [Mailhella sp.]